MEGFVNLQPDEKVVERIKPLPVLRKYWFVGGMLLALLVSIWFVTPAALFFASSTSLPAVLTGLILIVVLATVVWLLVGNKYENQEYMVTNKRVIYKHGLLGYTIHSTPLERITDVIVSRTFLENLFGFGSVLIQTMAGQVSAGRSGAELSLEATPEPEKLQEKIFGLIKNKRENEKLTF